MSIEKFRDAIVSKRPMLEVAECLLQINKLSIKQMANPETIDLISREVTGNFDRLLLATESELNEHIMGAWMQRRYGVNPIPHKFIIPDVLLLSMPMEPAEAFLTYTDRAKELIGK